MADAEVDKIVEAPEVSRDRGDALDGSLEAGRQEEEEAEIARVERVYR